MAEGVVVKLDVRRNKSLRKARVHLPGSSEPVLVRFLEDVTVICPRRLSEADCGTALEWVVGAYHDAFLR